MNNTHPSVDAAGGEVRSIKGLQEELAELQQKLQADRQQHLFAFLALPC
jgi:hypothetical protein